MNKLKKGDVLYVEVGRKFEKVVFVKMDDESDRPEAFVVYAHPKHVARVPWWWLRPLKKGEKLVMVTKRDGTWLFARG